MQGAGGSEEGASSPQLAPQHNTRRDKCSMRTFKRQRAAFQWPTHPARELGHLIRPRPLTSRELPLLKVPTLGSMPRCPAHNAGFHPGPDMGLALPTHI